MGPWRPVPARFLAASCRLRFDEQRFESVGSELELRSDDFAGAADRYEFAIAGGASELRITR